MADPAHWRPGPLRRVLPGEAPPGRPLPRGLPGSGRAAGLGGLITPAEDSWKKLSLSERNRPDRRRPITSQAMPAPLLAVDAPFLLYRSFFALPDSIHGDRKSTRLNSSHSQISYAVFCLKKKK